MDTDTSNELPNNMLILWKIGLVILQFSLAGSLFVAIRIIHRWRKSSLSSLAQRLPLYFCILDIVQYILYSITGITLFASGSLPSGESCKAIGGLICFATSLNLLMVGAVALATYLRVCRHIQFDFGEYDWKLHLIVIIPSVIATSLFHSEFGPDTYWCYVKRTSIVVPLINAITFFGSLLISAICYTCVILALRRATSILPQTSSRPVNFENQVYRKVISYVLMFLFNWILALPYILSFPLNQASLVVFCLCMIACCWGGILNAIAYIYNEGFVPKNNSSWSGSFRESQISRQNEPPRHQWQLDGNEISFELEERKLQNLPNLTAVYKVEPKNSKDTRWQRPNEVENKPDEIMMNKPDEVRY